MAQTADLLELSSTAVAVVYVLLGCVTVTGGVVLRRRLHLAIGVLLAFGGLSTLAFDVFDGSLLFAPVLALIGGAVLLVGVKLSLGDRVSAPDDEQVRAEASVSS